MFNLLSLPRIRRRRTLRASSWDTTGRNLDRWSIPAGKSAVLADIKGPGVITHIWMTQSHGYREALLRFTWDDAESPSVVCPLGDFFGLGHGIVNSYQSLLFTASTNTNNRFNTGCALNCYAPMPFRKRALIELVNEGPVEQMQYFYIDYEITDQRDVKDLGYFHAEFRRTNPFGGWGREILVNSPPADAVNKGRAAWDDNYVILDTKGRGHYLGCNLSVTNFQGTWWGEGDDMIWVDGYKWPPDLHGTGSEDYLNQAWGMQANAFLRNGTSIHENHTGGYQTSYVHHIENPVRFNKEIKVTIEHGHANHLANEMSSVAYWYAQKPTGSVAPPPVNQRLRVEKKDGIWDHDPARQCPGKPVTINSERRQRKADAAEWARIKSEERLSDRHSRFCAKGWRMTRLLPAGDVRKTGAVKMSDDLGWHDVPDFAWDPLMVCPHVATQNADGLIYVARKFKANRAGKWKLHFGHDAAIRVFVNGKAVAVEAKRINPAPIDRTAITVRFRKGDNEVLVALDTDHGLGWGFYFCFELAGGASVTGATAEFPA